MKEIPTRPGGTKKPANHMPLLVLLTSAVAVCLGLIIYSSHRPKTHSAENPEAPAAAIAPEAPGAIPDATPAVATPAPGEKPVIAAASVEVAPSASLAEWIKILRDPAQPIKARIKAANALLADGSDAAMAAIKETLQDGPPQLRAAIAEGLGSCPNPESYSLMLNLLSNHDEIVAMGAIRGIAEQGSAQAVNVLSQAIYDPTKPLNVRCEAALSLGTVNQPGVVDALSHAVANISDEAIATQLLNALGNKPFDETKGFFENYLNSTTVSSDLKVAAIEALGNAQGDVSSLLLGYVGNPDAELRASAAWTLSQTDTPGKVQDQITAWLQSENDPAVRLRLYQALGNQESFNVPMVEQLIQNEADLSARTAGYDLIAKTLRENPSPDLTAYFDATAVPALMTTAMSATVPSDRMTAVIALKRAGTPGAVSALQNLANQSTDPRVRKSAGGT